MYYQIGTLDEYGPIFAWKEDPKPLVLGGYYLGGNEDIRPNTINQEMNLGSFTQYRSFSDANIFPGWEKDYLSDLLMEGIVGNFVLELKLYGTLRPQVIDVESVRYTIVEPNMVTQRRSSTSYAISYGYDQVLSKHLDGLLHRAAFQLSLLPKNSKINIQLASEFDTDHEFGVKIGRTVHSWESADMMALRALEYIVKYFKDYLSRRPEAPTVTFSIGMGGFDQDAWIRMHPDWIAPLFDYQHYNVYRRTSLQTALERFDRTKYWSDNDLSEAWYKKDIIVAEWGTPASLGSQAAWISTVGSAIESINSQSDDDGTGRIYMANYFDSNPNWATLMPRQQGLDALKELYRNPPFTA